MGWGQVRIASYRLSLFLRFELGGLPGRSVVTCLRRSTVRADPGNMSVSWPIHLFNSPLLRCQFSQNLSTINSFVISLVRSTVDTHTQLTICRAAPILSFPHPGHARHPPEPLANGPDRPRCLRGPARPALVAATVHRLPVLENRVPGGRPARVAKAARTAHAQG